MQLVITDANIFIDLHLIGLLNSFFDLPFEFCTTIYVIEEVDQECADLITKRSTTLEIGDHHKQEIDSLNWNKGFSFQDKSILYFAKKNRLTVLSGERKMRTWCNAQDVRIHGIIFVFQRMISCNIHSAPFMADKLMELLDINQWLPTEICMKKIEEWRKQ